MVLAFAFGLGVVVGGVVGLTARGAWLRGFGEDGGMGTHEQF